jgi:hypothetical protein
LQDELADMADLTNEINEAMGQSYAIPDDVDEADLMAELDALEGDLALEDAVGASGPSYLQVRCSYITSCDMGRASVRTCRHHHTCFRADWITVTWN